LSTFIEPQGKLKPNNSRFKRHRLSQGNSAHSALYQPSQSNNSRSKQIFQQDSSFYKVSKHNDSKTSEGDTFLRDENIKLKQMIIQLKHALYMSSQH
jgi:hypothetical protein